MSIKHDVVDRNSINHQLKENHFFRNSSISDSDFDDLKLNIINLKTGEILFREGDSANSIYMIIEGEINLIKKQSFGKTHLCVSKNNFFGHEEYFLQTDRNSIAISLKDSCIVELSKELIEIFLSRDNSILNNVKNSFHNLDSESILQFENVIKEWPGFVEKQSTVLPIELRTIDDKKIPQAFSEDILFKSDSKISVYNKIDLNKIKFEINTVVNKFNENLLLLEEEKDKMRALISAYEDDNTRLLVEIEKLKEREAEFISSDKEKIEILGIQSRRIIELEEEAVKIEELESRFLKKIEHFNEQSSKDKTRIKKLDSELADKETIISKLENDFKENKKTLSKLNETLLMLTRKTDDQERVIKEQKTKLVDSDKRIEDLTLELSAKDVSLVELNENLLNKSKIISAHNDNANKANDELKAKDEVIHDQSTKIGELQSKLEYQKEIEKNRNDYILNQAHKIAEHEELLNNTKQELAKRDETINNFIREIKEHTEKVLQKQSLINDQNRVIAELSDEIFTLKKSVDGFVKKEKDFEENIADLKFHLSKANGKLVSISGEVKEKITLLEIKEKENLEIQKIIEDFKITLKEKDNRINDLDNIISQLKNELLESNKLKEEFISHKTEHLANADAYNELKNQNRVLSEQIETLKFQIAKSENERRNLLSVNDELNRLKSELDSSTKSYSELKNENSFLSEQIKTLKLQIEESENERRNLLSVNDELNRLKSELDSSTKSYSELKNENSFLSEQIKTLKLQIEESKNESSNLLNANYELNKLKSEFDSITNAYNELKNENSFLSEKVKTFRLRIEESKIENSNLISMNAELKRLKSEAEKYNRSIIERDKIIEEQKDQIENIRLANSKELKTVDSVKGNYEEETRKKDNKIAELIDKLDYLQRTLDEKTFFENQQVETIDNQAQKIAELELLVNESRTKGNNQSVTKEESVLKDNSPGTHSGEQSHSNENDEIFSKCKLIKTKSVDSALMDENFEHYQDFDVHIVNVNLTRATMDVVSIFNEFLKGIISKEQNKIIVNLLSCEFIDSSVLGALVSSLKKVTGLGGDMRLVGFRPEVRSMMELTRMLRLFEYFPTVEEAIRSFD